MHTFHSKKCRSDCATAEKTVRKDSGAIWMPRFPSAGRGEPVRSNRTNAVVGGGANNSPEDAGGIKPGVVLMEGVDCVRLMKSDSRAKSETKKPIYADIPPLFKGWFLASAQLPYLNRLFPRMNPKYPVGLLTSC